MRTDLRIPVYVSLSLALAACGNEESSREDEPDEGGDEAAETSIDLNSLRAGFEIVQQSNCVQYYLCYAEYSGEYEDLGDPRLLAEIDRQCRDQSNSYFYSEEFAEASEECLRIFAGAIDCMVSNPPVYDCNTFDLDLGECEDIYMAAAEACAYQGY